MNYRSFIFPAFEYDGFKDSVSCKGGQTFWNLFHDVIEKANLLEANLRKDPKIAHIVIHPGNCKQNIPVGLVNFHEYTSATLTNYFPEKKVRQNF